MIDGTIFKAMSGFYYVESESGIVECRARGKFRLEKKIPLVGDHVKYKLTEPNKGILVDIYPRKSEFVRPPVANIDIMIIIASSVIPVTDPYLIDRMTVIANKSNCEAVICINKCDLDPANELYNIYTLSGFKTIRTSAKTGQGISELIDSISNKTCAFTGNSGVGKSSILNAIDSNFKISVGDISKKLGRGRHTTRHVELFKLSCGAVIADTPGFSAFDTDFIAPKEEIQNLFNDFALFSNRCRFIDCAHIKEPDCSLLEALNEGKIQQSRYESYVRLYNQAGNINLWEHKN